MRSTLREESVLGEYGLDAIGLALREEAMLEQVSRLLRAAAPTPPQPRRLLLTAEVRRKSSNPLVAGSNRARPYQAHQALKAELQQTHGWIAEAPVPFERPSTVVIPWISVRLRSRLQALGAPRADGPASHYGRVGRLGAQLPGVAAS